MGDAKQKKVDKSLDMTFPASDPPASNQVTGTEPPARPASRQAPRISKEQVEAAAGAQRRLQSPRARKRDRGVGRNGLRPGDATGPGDEEGRGRDGAEPKPRRRG